MTCVQIANTEARRSNKLRQGFVSLAETLLESIGDVFPECEHTVAVLRIFRSVIKGSDAIEDRFIRKCHAAFKKNAEGIKTRAAESLFLLVESIEHLSEIDLREKWEDPDFTQESKDHLWQYIATLKTYADLYVAVPANVLGKIECAAGSLGDQLLSGQLDLRSVDIGAIGRDIMANLSAEDISGFEGNLPDIYDCLSGVTSSLGGAQGGSIDIPELMRLLSQQIGEGPGGDASVDMTQVLQMAAARAGGQGASVDTAQLLQTLAPLLSAMRAPAAPRAITQQ
jgi:hypothetical protein